VAALPLRCTATFCPLHPQPATCSTQWKAPAACGHRLHIPAQLSWRSRACPTSTSCSNVGQRTRYRGYPQFLDAMLGQLAYRTNSSPLLYGGGGGADGCVCRPVASKVRARHPFIRSPRRLSEIKLIKYHSTKTYGVVDAESGVFMTLTLV
jgi:hypothetical protein